MIAPTNYLNKTNPYTDGVSGKLEFETFLKSLELIAHKLFDNSEFINGLLIIIEHHLLNLMQN